MQTLFKEIIQSAKAGQAAVLLSITESFGSTPRGAGAKMLVLEDGRSLGTIGGGAIEFEAQNMAKTLFDSKKSVIQTFDLSQNAAAGLGMVCGGQAKVFLQYLDPHKPEISTVYEKALSALQGREPFVILTQTDENLIFFLSKTESDSAPLSYADISDTRTHLLQDGLFLVEPFCGTSRALIFGMGHVGAELVPLVQRIGFTVVAMDDRAEFLSKERLPMADERKLVDFENPLENLQISADDYIVILTRGHLHDHSVLRLAVRTNAGYIGLIGSRNKVALSLQKLREEGLGEADIGRIHAPIGLPIGGNTPEEIAISIAAEMIRVRAGLQ